MSDGTLCNGSLICRRRPRVWTRTRCLSFEVGASKPPGAQPTEMSARAHMEAGGPNAERPGGLSVHE